jgi:hypothetical protein
VEAAFGWFSDPEVMRFVPSGPDGSLEATRKRWRLPATGAEALANLGPGAPEGTTSSDVLLERV